MICLFPAALPESFQVTWRGMLTVSEQLLCLRSNVKQVIPRSYLPFLFHPFVFVIFFSSG